MCASSVVVVAEKRYSWKQATLHTQLFTRKNTYDDLWEFVNLKTPSSFMAVSSFLSFSPL